MINATYLSPKVYLKLTLNGAVYEPFLSIRNPNLTLDFDQLVEKPIYRNIWAKKMVLTFWSPGMLISKMTAMSRGLA